MFTLFSSFFRFTMFALSFFSFFFFSFFFFLLLRLRFLLLPKSETFKNLFGTLPLPKLYFILSLIYCCHNSEIQLSVPYLFDVCCY